jgi:two-component system, chemotaxis family, response regulator Rcp1
MLVREAFEMHDVVNEVVVISDGAKAVAFLDAVEQQQHDPPALILLDLNIPKIRGLEVLQHVRKSAACAAVPVVIFSSSSAKRDYDDALRFGATQYRTKPCELSQFMDIGADIKRLLI